MEKSVLQRTLEDMSPTMRLQTYLDGTTRRALRERVYALIQGKSEERFDILAGEVFEFQRERNEPFAQLCEARGWEQGRPEDPTDYPFVPTDAFKHYRLTCVPESPGEVHFHTSGTTDGRPGIHILPNTELYDAGALPRFAKAMGVNGQGQGGEVDFISLTSSPEDLPHSSLVHMISRAGEEFGAAGRVVYVWDGTGTEISALANAVEKSHALGRRVLLTTTAFALVDCIDRAGEPGGARGKFHLPPGSRIMETGGYKGRSRELDRVELYDETSRLFGISAGSIVNEYGMTEMSSQFYDRHDSRLDKELEGRRIKTVAPWVRSFVLDPFSLRLAAPGTTGILVHIDLANLDSCAFLLTSDAARAEGEGFELLGRLSEVEARGCSLDYETSA